MNIKQIEKATKWIAEIKDLDQQIILIEKCANLIANGHHETTIELQVKDLSPVEKKENIFDEHGFIKPEHRGGVEEEAFSVQPQKSMFDWFHDMQKKVGQTSPSKLIGLKGNLSDEEGLSILGIMISKKQRRRSELLSLIEGLK